EWADRSYEARADCLRKFKELVASRQEKLAAVLTAEMGKPLSQARNELKGLAARIDYFLTATPTVLAPESVFSDLGQKMEERIHQEPLGVIANISAWNYPYFVGSNVFVPALLTGNAVLYKPSELAAMTGLEITALLHESGVPKDVFAPVIGTGVQGAQLVSQPIHGVFFTGSYPTGKRIAEAVAGRMVRTQFELGGKDPSYIADDADVGQAAASTADGAMYNAGQSCCSVERIYAHTKIYDAFVDHFVREVAAFRMGSPTEEGVYIGPLTRAAQLDFLEKQVADALAKGAKLRLGTGKREAGSKGNYFAPVVLTDVDHTMELMREESFGPVIGIQRVRNDDEALDRMNDTLYGLTAGIYTRDRARAEKILGRVHAGSAYWNCCDRVSPRLPWSGRGNSGLGSTLSRLGIQAFVRPKAWHLKSI
ncbi:MAG: aldehyde dehydrogenase family protein, partial [Bdellovibrionota bacterium]